MLCWAAGGCACADSGIAISVRPSAFQCRLHEQRICSTVTALLQAGRALTLPMTRFVLSSSGVGPVVIMKEVPAATARSCTRHSHLSSYNSRHQLNAMLVSPSEGCTARNIMSQLTHCNTELQTQC